MTTFRSSTNEILRHFLGITSQDKEKTNVLGKKQEQRI
jgi:hypothetical protein